MYMAMDQYLLYNTIFSGMNIHLPAFFDVHLPYVAQPPVAGIGIVFVHQPPASQRMSILLLRSGDRQVKRKPWR